MKIHYLTPLVLACLTMSGCMNSSKPEVATKDKEPVVVDPFKSWPKDNVARPAYSGSVERTTLSQDGRSCFFMVPDWAEPIDKFDFKGPKGSTVWFAFSQRDLELASDEDARIDKLMREGNKQNQTLVVARPWRGWFGESNTSRGRLRVYTLVREKDALEIHAEWTNTKPEALAEAEELVAQIIYSVQAIEGS